MALPRKSPGSATPESLDGTSCRVAICVARFNHEITYAMRDLCIERLMELGVNPNHIVVHEVPGSFELPLGVMHLYRGPRGPRGHAVIAIGAVIRGETDHYEHIARAAADGLMRVALSCERPVIFGVLTTDTVEQARARIRQARHYAENAVELINAGRL